jgi:hypothetical protein
MGVRRRAGIHREALWACNGDFFNQWMVGKRVGTPLLPFYQIYPQHVEKRRHIMRSDEIQQRFSQIENTIHNAAKRCELAQAVPMDLKDSLQQLDQKAIHARNILQSQDENQIRKCVDELEELGDRAKDACEHSKGNLDGELQTAIMQAHRELSDLKHQLH